jgi:hypothetical protein
MNPAPPHPTFPAVGFPCAARDGGWTAACFPYRRKSTHSHKQTNRLFFFLSPRCCVLCTAGIQNWVLCLEVCVCKNHTGGGPLERRRKKEAKSRAVPGRGKKTNVTTRTGFRRAPQSRSTLRGRTRERKGVRAGEPISAGLPPRPNEPGGKGKKGE